MIEQRTSQWKAHRLSMLTGTRAWMVMGSAANKKTLMAEMIREVATATSKEFKATQDMQRGTDLEPEAVSYYEFTTGNTVYGDDCFIESDNPNIACSPDGLIDDDGGLEIKCLNEENHIKVILDDDIDKKHYWQIQWCMFVTGRKWWDYFGYSDTLPEPLKSYRKRFERDEKTISDIAKKTDKFLLEFFEVLDRLGLSI